VILEYALRPVKPGEQVDFESAFAEAKAIIAGMPGFLRLTLSRRRERPSTFLLVVEWDRLEDHMEGVRGSLQYQPVARAYQPVARAVARLLRALSGRRALRTGPQRPVSQRQTTVP
jgi:heme-degrading monooxygenase HmoA